VVAAVNDEESIFYPTFAGDRYFILTNWKAPQWHVFGDTRVAPLHARKMATRLQATNGSNRPILLLYDTKSGHSGGRPINKIIEENTDVLSFLFWQLGVSVN